MIVFLLFLTKRANKQNFKSLCNHDDDDGDDFLDHVYLRLPHHS